METLPRIVSARALPQSGAGALSRSLERQLLALCQRRGREVQALVVPGSEAPDTLSALVEATRDSEYQGGLLVPVSADNSALTIWSCPDVNALFRAWHDATHIALAAQFVPSDELRVARAQCAQIEGQAERALLWIETAGQVMYCARWGVFPWDQRAFAVAAVRDGLEVTLARGRYGRKNGT